MNDTGSIDERPDMLCHLAVGPVQCGIVQIGLDDAAFEVVDDDAFGDAAEELKHPDVRAGKAHLVLAKGELDILQAAVGEGSDEGVQFTPLVLLGIEHHRDEAVINLDFLSGR